MKLAKKTIAGEEKTLADTFKELRKRLGYTQTEMAQALYVTRVTIYRWENNKDPNPLFDLPMVVAFYKLLNQAGMDINDFPIPARQPTKGGKGKRIGKLYK